jgi:predicted RNase H-like HicB family nuclease
VFPDDEDGGYVAKIRELPGCLTQADTWDELLVMVEEAKRAWIESALEFPDEIPEPERLKIPQP